MRRSSGDGLTDTALVDIVATDLPAPPLCEPRSFEVARGQTLTATLECIDSGGGDLTYAAVDAPATGTLDLAPDGTFSFVPPDGFTGRVTFDYDASDGTVRSAPAKVTIDVRPANERPVCDDGSVDGAEDAASAIALACSDRETPADQLAYEIVDGPSHGSVAGSGATRTYVPDGDANGSDAFTFRARDRGDPDGCDPGPGCSGARASELATVRIATAPRNDAPACRPLSLTTDSGQAVEAQPDCTDVDGDALTYAVADQGSKGSASVEAGRLRFVPASGEHGDDAFTYVARDAEATSPPARVAVAIREPAVDGPPACTDLELDGVEDTPLTIDLACSDPEGASLTFDIAGHGPGHGTLEHVAGNRYRFDPAADWSGEDRFAYRASDGGHWSETASVRLRIAGDNDLPTCRALSVTTDEEMPAELQPACSDADGDALTFEVTRQGAKGRADVTAGALRYVPEAGRNGEDAFWYVAHDMKGASQAAQVAVTIRPRRCSRLRPPGPRLRPRGPASASASGVRRRHPAGRRRRRGQHRFRHDRRRRDVATARQRSRSERRDADPDGRVRCATRRRRPGRRAHRLHAGQGLHRRRELRLHRPRLPRQR